MCRRTVFVRFPKFAFVLAAPVVFGTDEAYAVEPASRTVISQRRVSRSANVSASPSFALKPIGKTSDMPDVNPHSNFTGLTGFLRKLTGASAKLVEQAKEYRPASSHHHFDAPLRDAVNGNEAFLQRVGSAQRDPEASESEGGHGIFMTILLFLWNMHWKFKIFWSIVLIILGFIAYEVISRKIDCEGKGMDPRTWEKKSRNIKTFLRWCGYDEFDEFSVHVKIHSVKDVKDTAWVGKSAFKVEVRFRWSRFMTTATQDMNWQESAYMDVPQGAHICRITLLSEGLRKDKEVGRLELETKYHLIDRPFFWGKQQRLQMTDAKDNPCGIVIATFRRVETKEGEVPLIEGLQARSELGCEIEQAAEEEPRMDQGPRPKRGEEKLQLLSRVLNGALDEAAGGKYERCYVKLINCNFADLQGVNRQKELAKQIEKARKQGLTELPKKWYFCWFPDKSAAEAPGFPNPDGFFVMTALLKVETTKTTGEFLVRYSQDGAPIEIKYKRRDKSAEVWVEGLEIFRQEVKKLAEITKGVEAVKDKLPRMYDTHNQYLKEKGTPESMDDWKQWFAYFKQKGFTEEMCKAFYVDLQKKQKSSQAVQRSSSSSSASASASASLPAPAQIPEALQEIHEQHQRYINEHGMPRAKEDWKRWFLYLSEKGYSSEQCEDLYLELNQM